MTLIEFVKARIDDDERAANAMLAVAKGTVLAEVPERMLREVALKRQLLEGHTGTHRCAWGDHADDRRENCAMQRKIAAVYSNHADYDEGWRP
jgi:hypothetical protein